MIRHACKPILLAAGLLMAVAWGGCTRDDPLCEPLVPAGRVQGHVHLGGAVVETEILFDMVVDGEIVDAYLRATPDASGAYVMDLPAGRYTVSLWMEDHYRVYFWSASGLVYGSTPPDTLEIGQSRDPHVIDFDLASVVVDVNLSDRLDGEYGRVILHLEDDFDPEYDHSYVREDATEIIGGAFQIPLHGVLPGKYKVEMLLGGEHYHSENGERIWWPATRNPDLASWVTVGPDDMVALDCEFTEAPGRVEGSAASALVDSPYHWNPDYFLVTPDSSLVLGPRDIEDDDTFGVDLHLAGPVKLGFDHYGLVQWYGGEDFDAATVIEVVEGQTVSDLDFIASGLRMNVAYEGSYVGEARFEFRDPVDGSLLYYAERYSYDEAFSFSNLSPGEYLIRILTERNSSQSWRPQWFDRAVSIDAAQLVTIPVEDMTTLDVVLEEGGRFEGALHLEEGPAGHYLVYAIPVDRPDEYVWDYAWSEEYSFAVQGLCDGSYRLAAQPRDYGWGDDWRDPDPERLVWHPGTRDEAAATVFEIIDASVIEDAGFTIPPPD